MESNELIFIILGGSAAGLLLIGMIAGMIYRWRCRVSDRQEEEKYGNERYRSGGERGSFIPLKDSSRKVDNSPIVPSPIADINRSSDIIFNQGHIYHGSPVSQRNSTLASYPKEIGSSRSNTVLTEETYPSYNESYTNTSLNSKDNVILDGLLESKKWKVKDYKVGSSTCYPQPIDTSPHRMSYQVW